MQPPRDDKFLVDGGWLVRRVVPRRGQPYEHRCSRQAFETVVHAIEEIGDAGCTQEMIAQREDLPFSQVAVALAFLKERGCIVPVHGRRHVPGSTCLFEDAMTEFWALAEAPTVP